jgi:hypothetical protein
MLGGFQRSSHLHLAAARDVDVILLHPLIFMGKATIGRIRPWLDLRPPEEQEPSPPVTEGKN